MVDSMMLAHVMTIIAVILSAFQGPDNDVIMTNGLIFPEKPDFDDDASMTKPHPDASSLVDDPTDEELNKWSEGLWQLMDKGFVDPGPAVEDGPPQNLYSGNSHFLFLLKIRLVSNRLVVFPALFRIRLHITSRLGK